MLLSYGIKLPIAFAGYGTITIRAFLIYACVIILGNFNPY